MPHPMLQMYPQVPNYYHPLHMNMMSQMYREVPNYYHPLHMMQSPPYYRLSQVSDMYQIPYQTGNKNQSVLTNPIQKNSFGDYGTPMTPAQYKNLPGVTPQKQRWGGSKKKVKYVKYKKDYITVNEYIKLAKKKKSKKN